MQKVSLGEVVRYMVKKAINSESGEFVIPVSYIAAQVYGADPIVISKEDMEKGGVYDMTKLKSSYVANTSSRMPEVIERDFRAKISFVEELYDDSYQDCAKITMVKGAVRKGSRKASDRMKEQKIIEGFREKLLSVMPDLSHLEGNDIIIAVNAIKAMKEIIKEIK
ncbi:hypothetical protein ECH1_01 [Escherichia virus ECH1]